MPEIFGDPVIPSELIIPSPTSKLHAASGALFVSGANLWFYSPLSGATMIQSAVTD